MICTVRDDGALCGCTDCTAAGTEHRKAEIVALLDRIGAEQKRVDVEIRKTLDEQQRHATTLVVLANLERAVRQIGGTLSDSQTDALRAATKLLADSGIQRRVGQKLYAPTPPPWASDPPPWTRGK